METNRGPSAYQPDALPLDRNTKRFKRTLIYFNTDTHQYAHFRGKSPLSSHKTTLKQTTDQRLKTMENEGKRLILFWLSFCGSFGAWKIATYRWAKPAHAGKTKGRNQHITHTSSSSLSRRRRLLFPVTPAVTAPASLAVHGVLPLVAPPGGRGLRQGAGPARGAGVPVRCLMDGRGLGLPPRGLGSLGVPRAPCWLTPPRDPCAFGERGLRGWK